MKDEHKTKEQLINELVEMRRRIAELEAADTEQGRAKAALRDSEERLAYSLRAIAGLGPGDHLCCIYETEEEHRAILTPFLRQGLARGEKVIYIVDAHTAETVLGYLRAPSTSSGQAPSTGSGHGLDVELYLASGQLSILTRGDTYMREGAFDPDAMIAMLRTEAEQALAEGYAALRVTGEMTWALRGLPGSERLIEYEVKLNDFLPGSKCMAICQYNRRRFDPAVLLDVLRTHPIAVIGTEIYDNFYYIPPAELLGGDLVAAELRRDMQNLAERKRAKDALKEYSERLEEMVEERTKELQDAHEQLIRREKLAVLGQMAGGVAHELRNPLGTISNAVYYLKMVQADADKTVKEYLDMIVQEVRNSDRIISNLLDFSRTRLPDRQKVTVSELVAQVLEKRPPPENVALTTQITSDLPPVCVDRHQMGQVLINLITNAYQAMPEGGNLTISAQAQEGAVALFIADTGVGISNENMAKLFEPLFTTKAKGLGLGLMVVKNLVKANGGSIEVESEVGKGSTFTVILPTR